VENFYFTLTSRILWETRTHQKIAVQAVEKAARYRCRVTRQKTKMVSITEVGMLVKKGGFSLALIIGMMETQSIMPPVIST